MLDWLRKQFASAPERPDPPAHEIFAIGDIHGRLDLLGELLKAISRRAQSTQPELIFLGDYIDRGPDSRGVVELLVHCDIKQAFRPVFLKGNHEATLLEFLSDPRIGPSWQQFGGGETLMSYGVRPPGLKTDASAWEDASRQLAKVMPREHRAFYEALELTAERGCYLFAHAGVNPSKPIDLQDEADLLWVREAFLDDDRALARVIVHGHTPQSEPSKDHRRIGLDLGGYQTGRLAAAHILGSDVTFVTVSA